MGLDSRKYFHEHTGHGEDTTQVEMLKLVADVLSQKQGESSGERRFTLRGKLADEFRQRECVVFF